MAIKGLSETRRLPRLGKVHLGTKKANANGIKYPVAVDYFVVTLDQNTPASAVESFKAIYGEKPKELKIMFPSDNEQQFFQQFYKRYGQTKGLLCKGDGEIGTEAQPDGVMVEKKCPCVYLTGDKEKNIKPSCRRVANLQFLLPDVNGVGVWQLDTGSYNSIININSMVDMVKGMCGKIVGIPLILAIQPQEAIVAGAKKTVYVLNLKMNNTLLQLMSANKKKNEDGALLPPADDKPEDLIPDGAESNLDAAEENPEEPPLDTPRGKLGQPPVATPATPAAQSGEISMDDLSAEPVIPTCVKCKKPMTKRDGVINKINPKTNQPYGFVKGWACVACKTFIIQE